MWKFIKTVGAQDKDDVTKLLPIGGLQKVCRFSASTDDFLLAETDHGSKRQRLAAPPATGSRQQISHRPCARDTELHNQVRLDSAQSAVDFLRSPFPKRVDQERSVHPKVFDIPIEIEDPLKTKSHAILSSLEGQPMREIMAAEDDVRLD